MKITVDDATGGGGGGGPFGFEMSDRATERMRQTLLCNGALGWRWTLVVLLRWGLGAFRFETTWSRCTGPQNALLNCCRYPGVNQSSGNYGNRGLGQIECWKQRPSPLHTTPSPSRPLPPPPPPPTPRPAQGRPRKNGWIVAVRYQPSPSCPWHLHRWAGAGRSEDIAHDWWDSNACPFDMPSGTLATAPLRPILSSEGEDLCKPCGISSRH